jgi:hypothetical protein
LPEPNGGQLHAGSNFPTTQIGIKFETKDIFDLALGTPYCCHNISKTQGCSSTNHASFWHREHSFWWKTKIVHARPEWMFTMIQNMQYYNPANDEHLMPY